MKTVKLSTKFASSIRVKGKSFVMFLRQPDLIEVHGAGVNFKIPVKNTEEEMELDYTDDFIWDYVKAARKAAKKESK